jgi:hypothetical protein
MPNNNSKIGERLIGTLIDEYALNDPDRVWASMPVDNNELTRGFHNITYRQFANGVNHATWWLKEQLTAQGNDIETIAYAGPKDLRYPVIAVAALKLEKKVTMASVERKT